MQSFDEIPSEHQKLLKQLGIIHSTRLGKGMQSIVYDYSEDKVIKIWLESLINRDRLHELKNFYQAISWDSSKVSLPEMYDVDVIDGIFFSLEKKLVGKSANLVYVESNNSIKNKLLNNYFELLHELESIKIESEYGEQFTGQLGHITHTHWNGFIEEKLHQTQKIIIEQADHDIENIDDLYQKYFQEILPKLPQNPAKRLVHGDLFLENVLATDAGEITSLIDFSPLTVVGDHLMDVTGMIHFVDLSEGVTEKAENYLKQLAVQHYPNGHEQITNYLLYYSLLFINCKSYDPRTYRWCKKNLQEYGYL